MSIRADRNNAVVEHGDTTYFIGTFRHARVARDVEKEAKRLLRYAGRSEKYANAFDELLSRYEKHRPVDGAGSPRVA
jgi:hypothetical protein